MTEFAIRLSGVTKTFGKHTAVDHLDLAVPEGSIYGLLGPNGSGKSTSIRMIMGIFLPDSGSVELFGGAPNDDRRARIGYLPEERGVYRKMKVVDLITFMGEIRGVPAAEGRRRAGDWLDRLGLPEWADKKVEDLSKGMQQKIQFICTVIHDPKLLILDEPFSGLDPINQDVLEEIVLDFHRKGTTILFSTHLMDQAERLCEHVCLISRSKKVLDGRLRDLKKADSRGVLAVGYEGPTEWMAGPEVQTIEDVGEDYHLVLAEGADHRPILTRALDAGVDLRRYELVEPRLHEIFVKHAGAEAAAVDGLPREAKLAGAAGGVA